MSNAQYLIYSIRADLRISHDGFDREIGDIVEAGRADLMLAGVSASRANDTSDPLIKRALSTYAKAEFGLDNPDAERYRAAYNALKTHLTISEEYTTEE